MAVSQVEWELEGEKITLETGRIAKQADGSVVVRHRDAFIMATVVSEKEPKEDLGFFPLSVEFREKFPSAGRIPGGFIKKEGRISDEEILTSRLIDRSLRPLFPENYLNETQVLINVFSGDDNSDTEVLGILAATAAVYISDVPWDGPVGGLRIVKRDGQLKAFSPLKEAGLRDLDIIASYGPQGLIMLEGDGREVSEADFIGALEYGEEKIASFLDLLKEWRSEIGREKRSIPEAVDISDVKDALRDRYQSDIRDALTTPSKDERYQKLSSLKERIQEELAEEFPEREGDISSALYQVRSKVARTLIVKEKKRIDGRSPDGIRPISIDVGLLPNAHGSALFTRGETQALVTCTLGLSKDVQVIDAPHGESMRYFLLDYHFPPYCVGEVRRLRGPGRREIGHGHLARRALAHSVPTFDQFSYTKRVVSDITESNGSSSMATVCGGSLSMMDAGVPLEKAVAGIAMGLIHEEDETVILSDILGDEDHIGDMDFKVAGTRDGITAVQMDNKMGSVPHEILEKALEQARQGRIHILEKMKEALSAPREKVSEKAPQVATVKIKPSKIGSLIGPKGKTIQAIQSDTNTTIEVDDDGSVRVYGEPGSKMDLALEEIDYFTSEVEVGKYYRGEVTAVKDFGAFVSVFAGKDGLIHISELEPHRVDRVEDVLREGDEVVVKILNIDNQGKISMSRKDALGISEDMIEN